MKNAISTLAVAALLFGAMGASFAQGDNSARGGRGAKRTSSSQAPNNPVYGLNFSPYVEAGQDPNMGSTVSSTQVTSLLTGLKGYTQWIRTLGTQNGLENVPPIARQMGFKTAIGAYIGSDTTVNNAQIANLVAAAKAGNVDIAIVGNEVLLNNLQSEAQLIAYIRSVKSQVPAGVQVTYADTWNTIVAHPNVIAAVDVVAVNIYPFYEDAPIDQALSTLQSDYAKTVQAANGKPVVITETGWPSSGSPPSFSPAAVPSLANEGTYLSAVESWARSSNIPLFWFESYDEPWKALYNDYPSWGIWDANGNLKPGMATVFQTYNWQAVDVSVDSDNKAKVLWTSFAGLTIVWSVNPGTGAPIYGPVYGPYLPFTANAIACGANGNTRVVWNDGNGTAALWEMDAGGNLLNFFLYGPYPGWTATDVSVGSDGNTRLLWTSGTGAMTVWTVNDSTGAFTYGPVYGPYLPYLATNLAAGSDGKTRVIWSDGGGDAALWEMDGGGNMLNFFLYGPYAGWTATDLAVGSDGNTHLLWTTASGSTAIVWTVNDSTGSFTYGPAYGPYSGASASRIAGSASGPLEMVWQESSGIQALWNVGNNDVLQNYYLYGPY